MGVLEKGEGGGGRRVNFFFAVRQNVTKKIRFIDEIKQKIARFLKY